VTFAPPTGRNWRQVVRHGLLLLLIGSALGAIMGLTGWFVTRRAEWLIAIPIGAILAAIEPLILVWLSARN
jgi:hypothetical protein